MEIPDDAMYGIGPHWRKWLSDHATDHFGFEAKHPNMAVPTLTQTGWYDQQVMSIKNFTGLKENAGHRVGEGQPVPDHWPLDARRHRMADESWATWTSARRRISTTTTLRRNGTAGGCTVKRTP